MHTVSTYGEIPGHEGEALLEQHDFMSEAEARELTRQLCRDGAQRVTLDGNDVARFTVRTARHQWTYSGITAGEAQEIASALSRDGKAWTVQAIG
jgi:hypothetical protein